MQVTNLRSIGWKRGLMAFAFILVANLLSAQTVFKGKVTSSDGNPISGASVQLDPGDYGASTDANGVYSFSTSLRSGRYTLTITNVGYKAANFSIAVVSGNTYENNATLSKDITNMDQVVVIGSSLKQSRKQLGNTVNSVSSKQLANSGSGNITSALQGKVPGAQITQTSGDPAGAISVRMRGTSTIFGSAEPLYVIDGVVVSNATTNVTNLNVSAGSRSEIGTNRLADINPNDIESIDVIPGAAASAIYGSRATNGVVLITTKKGKAGQAKVEFSSSLMSNSLRKRVYISTYGKQFGTVPLRLGNIANAPAGYTGPTVAYTRPDGAARNFANGLVDVTRYDYQDQIFQTGIGTDNHISVSGGTDKTKYYFSGGYFKNEGIIANTDFRRYNFKTRVETALSKYITMVGGVAFTNSFANEKPNGNVFWSPINSVNITNNIWDITKRDAGGNLQAVEPTRVNPLSVINETDITQEVNRTISDLQIKIKPIKGLTIDYIFGSDQFAQEGKNYIKRYPYSGAAFEPLGYVGSALVNTQLINNDINVSYSTKNAKISSLTTLGFNHQFQKTTGVFNQGRDLQNGISNITGAAIQLPQRYTDDRKQIYGAFLQQTFGLNNYLFLTAAARVDGSTVYPADNRNYLFPKISASWNVSDMNFWDKLPISKWFNSARLRTSWGQAGNLTGIGSYDRFTTFNANNINGVATFNLNSALGNPLVEPERAEEFEIGTDLSLLKNKLGLTFTVYDKKIIDRSLLVNRVLAPSSGGATAVENVGNLTNKGWELGVNATVLDKKDFNIALFGNVNRNKNLVTASSQVAPIILDNALGATNFTIQAGQPVGVFYGNYFVRDASGALALDAGGRPIAATSGTTLLNKVLGDPNPDWIVSWGTNVNYKKWGFSALFDGALGHQVFNADRRTRQGVGVGDLSEKEIKGEVPRGYIFSIYVTEEWRVESGNYIKLRELALNYQLPAFAKFVKSSSLSLIGRNLLSFDTYDGYDPETNAGGNSAVLRGIDFGNVPIPRTVQLTFRANF
jgi:TonB-linked SusC/RagA family outer membrane protein